MFLPLILSVACSSSETYPELEQGVVSDAAFLSKGDADAHLQEGIQSPLAEALAEPPSEIISLEAKKIDCEMISANSCNSDEPSNPFRCSLTQNNKLLIPDSKQLHAWGDSRCFAQHSLKSQLCRAKVIINGGSITCHPDTTPPEECSLPLENCDAAPAGLTKCFAKEIDSTEVAWTHRPESWGKSECEARNNLRKNACSRGIAPSEIKTVACVKEVSPAVCPPIQQNCLVQENDLVECQIRKIGDIPLLEALKGMGSSTCEASYRVKDLACRWQRKEISDLNDVECRSVSKGESFSSSANAKTYKKVKILKL